jgi:hypothetical protein
VEKYSTALRSVRPDPRREGRLLERRSGWEAEGEGRLGENKDNEYTWNLFSTYWTKRCDCWLAKSNNLSLHTQEGFGLADIL